MYSLTLKIDLLAPLLIGEIHQGDPNSAIGLTYMPGSTLRGALINRYIRQHNISDLLADNTGYHLFFSGAVRYLNAYPVDQCNQRLLPTPLSWRVEKGKEKETQSPIYDIGLATPPDAITLKPLGAPFCFLDSNENITPYTPPQTINVHIYRANRSQQTDEGTIYRYEALAKEQTLQAIILADDPTDLATLQTLFKSPRFILGKSRHAGYGQVNIEVSQDTWSGEYISTDNDDDKIIVTCLSDILIRDEQGAYTNTFDTLLPSNQPCLKAYTQTHLIGGFNRTWGLPLPHLPAIKAGSVFVYEYNDTLWQQWQTLAQTGVGERLTEGFGRVAINWQYAAELQHSQDKTTPKTGHKITLSQTTDSESTTLARQISTRILKNRLDTKLKIAISQYAINTPPVNTQLARLRTVIQQVIHHQESKNIEDVTEHLEDLTQTATRQFQKAQINQQPLLTWLNNLLHDPQQIWGILNPLDLSGPDIGGEQAQRTPEMAEAYTLRFINALLLKASKGETDA